MKANTIQRIILHAAFWVFYLLVSNAYYAVPGKYTAELKYTAAMLPFYILFTYPQVYLFIPKLLLRKRTLLYVLISLLFAKIVWWLNFSAYNHFLVPLKFGGPVEPFFYSMPWEIHFQGLKSVFPMVMICGVAVSIKLIKKWYLQNELNQQMQNEKLAMELEMLKAQVHPHFLFNTLNNLYSLTLTRSDAAPIVVTHLSGLLRYMLYECSQQEVLLNNEIAALKKYVELEKLRYGSRLDVSFSCTGELAGLMIAPLLLLPFVENSFKHGVSEQLDQCWVNIHLHADADELTFNLSNSCSEEKRPAGTGGIGLSNIRKRLELIYRGLYQLSISEQEETYAIKLTMQLSRPLQLVPSPENAFANNLSLTAL